ncbi:HU family DNA-binding protein [Blastococcus sp. Marseille-P5729]|uniref:HU family DNA-binding protein n=1 Tax=Blastococcus sp. Marseille-P5729 TaxID=2086582 RepID=UPI000D0F9FDD|nr:HU family DNA-binding protein [Blastococcus sp. Marseille-P5729]
MNKSELIDALAVRLGGDKKGANAAIDAFVDVVFRAVAKGEKVSIAGFGVFEKRPRAARIARNPATGEPVKLKKTSVPAFRPGTSFKGYVSGQMKLGPAPKPAKTTTKSAAKSTAAAAKAAPAKKAAAKKTASKAPARAAAKKSAATAPAKKTATKSTATKSTAAKKTAAKKTAAKTTARKTAAKAPAKKTTARKAPAKKTTARKAPAKK